jgi:uncharacterized repeat protein (TIGR01451 family)
LVATLALVVAAAMLALSAGAREDTDRSRSSGSMKGPFEPAAVSVDDSNTSESPSSNESSGAPPPEGVSDAVKEGPIPEPRQREDPVAQVSPSNAQSDSQESIDRLSDPIQNFSGMSGFLPPDTTGDVGPDHFVQMINATRFEVFDKQGNSQFGPMNFSQLWVNAGKSDTCTSDLGDPIVVYDHLANRWLLSQFARNPNAMCVAISQSPDPSTGNWFLYTFPVSDFPDYPKFGVWPDGYYMSTFEGSDLGAFAFDRINMVNGNAAGFFKDTIPAQNSPGVRATRILPSDLDGPKPPPDTPNFFLQTVDDQQDGSDRVEVYEADVDWQAQTFSFSLTNTLTPSAFDIMVCDRNGAGIRDCVPQPDEDDTVDSLSNRPMMQLKYRNFGSHESMVVNQTVDVSGSVSNSTGIRPRSEVAGIRWYELRGGSGMWGIHQEGTYAPQPIDPDDESELIHRWMGSAAMDASGNIALGYSAGNSDDDNGEEIYPGIRYAGRMADDNAGRLPQGEKVLQSGTTSAGDNDGTAEPRRWGDYSHLNVDPSDGCTFWYTHHDANADTRIGSFQLETCNETDLSLAKSDVEDPVVAGGQLIYELSVANNGPDPASDVEVVETLPLGLDYVADSDNCTLSFGTGPNGEDQLTCDLGDIASGNSASFTVKLSVPQDFVVGSGGAAGVENEATVSSTTHDADETNNTAKEGTLIEEESDVAVTKTCQPDDELLAGETGFCDIVVENHGPSAARDVELTDEITTDTTLTSLSASPSQGSCSASGSTVDCALGNIDAGDSATVRVEFSADDPGDINDRATVSSATPDPDTGNNADTDSVTVTPSSDVALTKSDSPDPVRAGTGLTYTLDVTNNGPSTAPNVVVEDALPAGITVDSVTGTGGASCTTGTPGDPSHLTTCSFGSLSSSSTETMTIQVTVPPDLRGTLRNEADASSDHPDPDTSNNSVVEKTRVVGRADLTIDKTSDKSTYGSNEQIVYTVTAENLGSSDARNVEVVDELPLDSSRIIYVSDDQGCTYDSSPHTVTCSVGTMDPGDVFTVNITVEPTREVAGSTITNEASVTSTTTDPDSGNNDTTHDVTVERRPRD